MAVKSAQELKAPVFHIIRGSFVDGHGVRTTVFLKGCPLRCLWCCNPEGQEALPELKLTMEKCNECGNCVKVCSPGAIKLNCDSKEKITIDRELCNNCGQCVEVCYTGALEFFDKEMTVGQVYAIVSKDREFYRRSGGGVTIGGGEPTFHADFTYALMKKCQENGIHVAVDTCGYTKTKKGIQILEEADLLLFDIKGIEPAQHEKNTGVSNKLILENLDRVGRMGRPIIIRMPLIPGYNDSQDNLEKTAKLLKQYKSIERIDILPYHKFGTVKYDQLSREYRMDNMPQPPIEYGERIKKFFESQGLKAQIGG